MAQRGVDVVSFPLSRLYPVHASCLSAPGAIAVMQPAEKAAYSVVASDMTAYIEALY